jgi:tRNA threonylcarbamoyl adenosine modification protein YeaZ
MDWLLAFDASTPVPTIVLGTVEADGDDLVASDAIHSRANQASSTLMPRLEAIVSEAGIRLDDVATIGCGRGPGTFTGSRVAAAAAKGLALGLGVPVLPISTLAALAGGARSSGPVLALLDARRHEVYAGLFECDGVAVRACGDERCAGLSDVLGQLDAAVRARVHLLGPGVGAYEDQIPAPLRARSASTEGLSARGLWRAAVSAHRDGAAVAPAALEVTYLRASYAEMGINTPKRPLKRSPWV